MKLGIYLPSFAYDPAERGHREKLRTWATRAEELGFESLWVTDHLLRAKAMYAMSWLEPLLTLAFVASVTEKVSLGTGVLLLPHRQPVLLAKEVGSLQELSGGRLILGVGTGWSSDEAAAMGTSVRVRGQRTDEVLEIVRRLIAGESVNHEGKFFTLKDVRVDPSPWQLPIWTGGGSQVAHEASVEKPVLAEAVARRIASSDGWFIRPTAAPQQIEHDWQELQPYLRAAGRDPKQLVVAHGQWLHLTTHSDPRKARQQQHDIARQVVSSQRPEALLEEYYLFGTIDEVLESCRRRADAGVEYLIIHPYVDDVAQLELWGRELLPEVQKMKPKQLA